MNASVRTATRSPLTLTAQMAEELMETNPVSLRAEASIEEALALLVDKGYAAAPVIDEAGQPIGVISRTDLLAHERESMARTRAGTAIPPGGHGQVRDIMTPAVFSVVVDAPAEKVVAEIVGLNVQHLFVVDHDGILVGVISALDVLRQLH